MTIGEKIKYYRLEKGMTQEKLASEMNISFQAVSKWERNESLPDVTIIGRLSDILGVSCDALLTNHEHFGETEVQATLGEAESLNVMVHEEYCRKIELLEKALERHPRSIQLKIALADTYSKGGDYPEYTEHDYLHRAIDLNEFIAKNADNTKSKYHAIQTLCYLYRTAGKYRRVKELAESMPEIYQSKPALLYHSMPENSINQGICDYICQLLDTAETMMNMLLYPSFGETEKNYFNQLKIITCSYSDNLSS